MKKGKEKEVCFFFFFNGGVGIPTQHFAATTGDFFYHNASGFANKGNVGEMELGLNFPKENCEVSMKTIYGVNEFNMDSYLKFLQNPDWNFHHPGATGINYSAVSSGFYKYVSVLFKVESEIPVKKFAFGFYCAAGYSQLLSFPDVKVNMDSSSYHIVTGFSKPDSLNYYGVCLNYGLTSTLHIGRHFFIKAVADYLLSHYVFNLSFKTPTEYNGQWTAKKETIKYAYPLTILNFSLGFGYRF
jgi:hypothetical protein